MLQHPELVDSESQLAEICEKLSRVDIIAVDTEFIRETTFYPQLEIIQIASEEESWLVDYAAFSKKKAVHKSMRPLIELLENRKVMKIMHAAQGDQECFYHALGVTAKYTLDTAVAASLIGIGDGIGLASLLKAVLNVRIKKGHARTNWSARPLPKQLIEYAHADVIHLVRLARELIKKLDELDRKEWALELTSYHENHKLYESDPEGLANRLIRSGKADRNSYPVLLRLAKWREKRVREINVPKKRVADDGVLIDLSRVKPTDKRHLGSFRGLAREEVRKSGDEILRLIEEGINDKTTEIPDISSKKPPSQNESQMIELLKCYVGILAARHNIAVKHLLVTQACLPFLRTYNRLVKSENRKPNADDLAREGVLSAGAAKLVGNDLIELLQGNRSISVKDGLVDIVRS